MKLTYGSRPKALWGPKWAPKSVDPLVRRPRYPLMNQLNPSQVDLLRTIAATYIPDMREPSAVEVLLVLLEVCHILDLLPGVLEQIFGQRVLRGLESWGDIIPTEAGSPKAPRAWVWLPGQPHPKPYRIEAGGIVRLRQPEA